MLTMHEKGHVTILRAGGRAGELGGRAGGGQRGRAGAHPDSGQSSAAAAATAGTGIVSRPCMIFSMPYIFISNLLNVALNKPHQSAGGRQCQRERQRGDDSRAGILGGAADFRRGVEQKDGAQRKCST